MRGLILAEDNNVVKVHNQTFLNQLLKGFFHQHGKGGGRVGHSKVHDAALKRPVACAEGSFCLIPWCNADLVVS